MFGYPTIPIHRGGSSAGRALRSQCRGREFDPPPLHHVFPKRPVQTGLLLLCPTDDSMDAGGTTPGTEEVGPRREQRPRATPGRLHGCRR